MKYSILVPYFNRPSFHNTLVSWSYHYSRRSDWEVVLVLDSKTDVGSQVQLGKDLIQFRSLPIRYYTFDNEAGHTGVKLFNFAARVASGDYLVLTNPECVHAVNILSGLDGIFGSTPHAYVVCAALNVHTSTLVNDFHQFSMRPLEWYQHSALNNRRLHFCSCIHRSDYERVGGFDEGYDAGVAYDDDDFLMKVTRAGMEVVTRDDLLVYHQTHSRAHHSPELDARNRGYYLSKWGLRR